MTAQILAKRGERFIFKVFLIGLFKYTRVTLAAFLSGAVFTLLYHLSADRLPDVMPEVITFMIDPIRITIENALLIILVLFICFFCFRDMTRREVIISALVLCVYYIIAVGMEQSMAAQAARVGFSARLIYYVPGVEPWWYVPFAMPLTTFRHLQALFPDYGELLLGMTTLFPLLYALLAWCRRMKRNPLY